MSELLRVYNEGVTKAVRAYRKLPVVTPLLVEDVCRHGVNFAANRWGLRSEIVRDWVGLLPARQRESCGTPDGRDRHFWHSEQQCESCAAIPPHKHVKGPAKCGTRAGYERHRRSDRDFCEPCRAAQREYDRWREQHRRRDGAA